MANAAVTWALGFAGGFVLYMGITGQHPRAELAAALTGDPNPSREPPLLDGDGAAGATGVPATSGAGWTLPGAGGGSIPTVGSVWPQGRVPTPSELVSTHGVKLNPIAAASFQRVEARYGKQINGGGFRTRAEQCATRKANGCKDCTTPGAAAGCTTATAPAGESEHEYGNAIDVVVAQRLDPKLHAAFTAEGWIRYDPAGEPWHWAHGRSR